MSPHRNFCHVVAIEAGGMVADENLRAVPSLGEHRMDGDQGGRVMGVDRSLLELSGGERGVDPHSERVCSE